jgi:hypothetical protein
MGGMPGGDSDDDAGNEEVVRELEQLREEVRRLRDEAGDARRELRRIADALED